MIVSYDIIIHLIKQNMTTISVPLPPHMVEFIEREVKMGNFANKAAVVRNAIKTMKDEQAIARMLQADKELSEGKILKGDLDVLAKRLK